MDKGNKHITFMLNKFTKEELFTSVIDTDNEKPAISTQIKKNQIIKDAINILTEKFSDLDELILFLHLRYLFTQSTKRIWNTLEIKDGKRFKHASDLTSEKVKASMNKYFARYNVPSKTYCEKMGNCLWTMIFLDDNQKSPACIVAHFKLSLIFSTRIMRKYILIIQKVLRKTYRGKDIEELADIRVTTEYIQKLSIKPSELYSEKYKSTSHQNISQKSINEYKNDSINADCCEKTKCTRAELYKNASIYEKNKNAKKTHNNLPNHTSHNHCENLEDVLESENQEEITTNNCAGSSNNFKKSAGSLSITNGKKESSTKTSKHTDLKNLESNFKTHSVLYDEQENSQSPSNPQNCSHTLKLNRSKPVKNDYKTYGRSNEKNYSSSNFQKPIVPNVGKGYNVPYRDQNAAATEVEHKKDELLTSFKKRSEPHVGSKRNIPCEAENDSIPCERNKISRYEKPESTGCANNAKGTKNHLKKCYTSTCMSEKQKILSKDIADLDEHAMDESMEIESHERLTSHDPRRDKSVNKPCTLRTVNIDKSPIAPPDSDFQRSPTLLDKFQENAKCTQKTSCIKKIEQIRNQGVRGNIGEQCGSPTSSKASENVKTASVKTNLKINYHYALKEKDNSVKIQTNELNYKKPKDAENGQIHADNISIMHNEENICQLNTSVTGIKSHKREKKVNCIQNNLKDQRENYELGNCDIMKKKRKSIDFQRNSLLNKASAYLESKKQGNGHNSDDFEYLQSTHILDTKDGDHDTFLSNTVKQNIRQKFCMGLEKKLRLQNKFENSFINAKEIGKSAENLLRTFKCKTVYEKQSTNSTSNSVDKNIEGTARIVCDLEVKNAENDIYLTDIGSDADEDPEIKTNMKSLNKTYIVTTANPSKNFSKNKTVSRSPKCSSSNILQNDFCKTKKNMVVNNSYKTELRNKLKSSVRKSKACESIPCSNLRKQNWKKNLLKRALVTQSNSYTVKSNIHKKSSQVNSKYHSSEIKDKVLRERKNRHRITLLDKGVVQKVQRNIQERNEDSLIISENLESSLVQELRYAVKSSTFGTRQNAYSICVINFEGADISNGLQKLLEMGVTDGSLPSILKDSLKTGQTNLLTSQ